MSSRFDAAIDALDRTIESSDPFRQWLRSKRWCGESIGSRSELRARDRAVLSTEGKEALVVFLVTVKEGGESRLLHLPLSLATVRFEEGAFPLTVGANRFYVMEAERRERYAEFLVEGLQRNATIRTTTGDSLRFRGGDLGTFRSMLPTAVGDSSNLLLQIATARQEIVVKSYKLLDPSNREPEILERLSRKEFVHVADFLGDLSLGRGPDRVVLGLATRRIDAVDLFTWLTAGWRMELGGTGAVAVPVFERSSLELAHALGRATAALHEALVDRRPGPFQIEPFDSGDAAVAYRAATTNLGDALRRLGRLAKQAEPETSALAATARQLLLDARRGIEETLRGIEASVGTPKCVTHADLHLAQVLRRTTDGQIFFIDFEGEPERISGQRSKKLPPLRDVATMNRSFAYVAHYAWRDFAGGPGSGLRLLDREGLQPAERAVAERLIEWEAAATDRFAREYLRASELYRATPPEEGFRAIRGWMMEKALYELRYELMHRPANLAIPAEGIVRLATTTIGVGP